jgi:NAD(P)H dehydrogenase (quinone)
LTSAAGLTHGVVLASCYIPSRASGLTSHEKKSMPHHLRKADAEELIRATVPALTVLLPAAYLQNLLDAARLGRIEVPYSLDAPFTLVDLHDVAEVAARVLTEQGHERATYELAGPELATVRGLASVASDTLGRSVVAVETDRAAWCTGPGADLSDSARGDLLAMFAAYDKRGLVGNATVLTILLGRPPRTWRDLLAASKYDQHFDSKWPSPISSDTNAPKSE